MALKSHERRRERRSKRKKEAGAARVARTRCSGTVGASQWSVMEPTARLQRLVFPLCEESVPAGGASARVHAHIASTPVQSFIPVSFSENSLKVASNAPEVENVHMQTPVAPKQQVAFSQSRSECRRRCIQRPEPKTQSPARGSSGFLSSPELLSEAETHPPTAARGGGSLAL